MKTGDYKKHCEYCGANGIDLATGRWNHPIESCPAIEEIEYYENGTVKRIKKRASVAPTGFVPMRATVAQAPTPHHFTATPAPYPNSNPTQGNT